LLGLAALMRMNMSGVNLVPLGQGLLARAEADADDACALMDAATILQFQGQLEIALAMQREALQLRRNFFLPARVSPVRLRVLALMASGDLMANVPLDCLLEESDVDLHLHYVLPGETLADTLPEHDVLFVALSETEANRPLLNQLCRDLASWPRPVLNPPERIPRLARDRASTLLDDQPGIAMPPTIRVARDGLTRIADRRATFDALILGGDFPIIIRPLDSHAGNDLQKIDDVDTLRHYLAMVSHDRFFVSPFVDYRSSDGLFRKYRIALIDGRPYACHMAISSHWMIHYLNAGMADSADKRAEEARFMASFDQDFVRRHGVALQAIHERMGLDYVCIDCAEAADGRLLIFEVDHAMIVHAMDPVDIYPYKQPQMRKVMTAFRDMLGRAAKTADGQ
jgi:glutathione synthase/RimK-type ligase-like ATP-grasp enzyme